MTPTLKEQGKPILPPCQLTRLRLHPKGTSLAAACVDGVVRRWTMPNAESLPDLKGHDGWVTDLVYLPSGQLLTADSWGKLIAWNGETPRWQIPAHDGWLRAIAVQSGTNASPALATCGRDRFVRFWDSTTGKKLRETSFDADLFSLAFTPNGQELFVGDHFGTIHVLDATGKVVRKFQQPDFHKLDRIQDVGGIRGLLFSPDGTTLYASGCQPRTGGFVQAFPQLMALDPANGNTRWTWKASNDNEGILHDLRWLVDGILAGVTSGQPGQGRVHLWQPPNPTPVFTSSKQPNCHSLDSHAASRLLAVSATNANSSGNGRVKGKDGAYPENQSPIQLWTWG